MLVDALSLLSFVLILVPLFMRSPRAFGAAVLIDVFLLGLLSFAIISASTIGEGPTMAKAIVIVLLWAAFAVSCAIGIAIQLVRSKRRRALVKTIVP